MVNNLSISFFGDFAPINRIEALSLESESNRFDSFKEAIDESDFVVANLECPLTTFQTKISKIGPNIKADPLTIEFIRYLRLNLLTLANNHIFDFGNRGFFDTTALLESNCISYTGISHSIDDRYLPYEIKLNNISIGILNICEREFNFSLDNYPTTNFFDFVEVSRIIIEYKKKYNYFILVYHGGKEHYNLPSPELQKRLHFFADLGCDIIICHHTHTVSGFEKYKSSNIFYGLGNFIFDWKHRSNSWYLGAKLKVLFSSDAVSFELLPFFQNIEGLGFRYLQKTELDSFNEKISELNYKISNLDVLKLEWRNIVFIQHKSIFNNIFSLNQFHRRILNKGFLPNFFYSRRIKYILYNILICESHYETVANYLINTIEDDRNI